MGATYTIYDRATKEMFFLGKLIRRESDMRGVGFRTSNEDGWIMVGEPG